MNLVLRARGAPPAPPEALLGAPLDGDRFVYGAAAGIGAAAEVAPGASATPVAFEGMEDDPTARAIATRAYGGLSFSGGAPGGAWVGFGASSLVVPRILYASRGSGSFVRVAAPRGDPRAAADLDAAARAIDAAVRAEAPRVPPPRLSFDDADGVASAYRALVARAVGAIGAGAFAKVVVARARPATLSRFDPASTIARLREADPASTPFAFGRAGKVFLGATPERLVSLAGGAFSVDALAGSWPRGATRGLDDAARSDLLASEKEAREHALVVRAILSSLAPLARTIAASPRGVRTLASIHHLATTISGEVPAGVSALDLVRALHPTPAVGGLPRGDALAFLREHEGLERGWYAAPVGHVDERGEGAFSVAIRSALVAGTTARLFAGAGIVRGSDPDDEWNETLVKERTMRLALGGTP